MIGQQLSWCVASILSACQQACTASVYYVAHRPGGVQVGPAQPVAAAPAQPGVVFAAGHILRPSCTAMSRALLLMPAMQERCTGCLLAVDAVQTHVQQCNAAEPSAVMGMPTIARAGEVVGCRALLAAEQGAIAPACPTELFVAIICNQMLPMKGRQGVPVTLVGAWCPCFRETFHAPWPA
jgi:hypothetical protein